MAYTIMISEEQRLALLELVESAPLSTTSVTNAPLEYWVEMLKDLPKEEAQNKGIIHGFCL